MGNQSFNDEERTFKTQVLTKVACIVQLFTKTLAIEASAHTNCLISNC